MLVGRGRLLKEWAQPLTEQLQQAMADAEADGKTTVAVALDGKARGV